MAKRSGKKKVFSRRGFLNKAFVRPTKRAVKALARIAIGKAIERGTSAILYGHGSTGRTRFRRPLCPNK